MNTRDRLIDVARNLFLYKGIEKTTMNDIAAASDRGRRTLYTYFRNKKEIYHAVLEKESETLVAALREIIANNNLTPPQKLRKLLTVRIEQLNTQALQVNGHSPIFNILKPDFRRMIRIRSLAWEKAREMIDTLLQQGIQSHHFDPVQATRLRNFISETTAGIAYIQYLLDCTSEIPSTDNETAGNFIDFIMHALQPANDETK